MKRLILGAVVALAFAVTGTVSADGGKGISGGSSGPTQAPSAPPAAAPAYAGKGDSPTLHDIRGDVPAFCTNNCGGVLHDSVSDGFSPFNRG